ncbi:probable G-protein coupled receptor 160 [Rhinatrema bivittatum]|uniref:probable G-protein coupled receptor 160 n=1 Tax=Rhinatrema bivittatum TaxID=194408 RepID=UPI0011270A73|nr:probable G-protein coupled receptor 160 [Rhinatrema bivittatum]XP_029471399.1 probable G-protein coupled receptor 160 [Rhinatrema bivittatum]XP_029471400.1 probable G-protein coupled receptor 160 [Rhinatrema bivittatum]XP_029471401.1 probable G-protein coupled receptor 160 [Rhinatrema bivittatum]XP_029471402.1 probable G-protein coupled receptor 160 [Rhinatrema bivittatum]XP_029471403.1 probable G-protein coupled receptor 160 [Rhinatrema bivittatum]XP_029471404.1 probable G-protein coupled
MEALTVVLHNETHLPSPDELPLEPSCMLLLIVLGKMLLNLMVFGGRRRRSLVPSFLGYFSISLALVDAILLMAISFIVYFNDFALRGIRFTKYHVCLLTQIISFTYGILHFPVFLVAGLDYFLLIAQPSKAKYPDAWQRLGYGAVTLLVWIVAFCYVLSGSVHYSALDINASSLSYLCPFYVSSQSFWLSVGVLSVTCSVVVLCWFEVIGLLQSVRMVYYLNETVLQFSFAPRCTQPGLGGKQLLTAFVLCFLATWAPFVVLQMMILFLGAEIPAYMDMNVPWLYFLNSLLIGAVCWCKRSEVQLADQLFLADPFVSWKFCFIPLNSELAKETAAPAENPLITIII